MTAKEVTDKKKLEMLEKESYQTTRALLNSTVQAAVLLDAEGRIIQINDRLSKFFGRTSGEMLGEKFDDFIPHDYSRLPRIYEETIQTRKPAVFEFEYNSKWYRATSYPVLADTGIVYRISVFAEDITEIKHIEQQLLEYQNHLESLVKERTAELEEMNAALKVLIKERDLDKEVMEQKIIYNLKELIFPIFDKIRNCVQNDRRIMNLLEIAQQNFDDITSSFSLKLSSRYFNLTPTELNVASLVKYGKSTKDISESLSMAYNTVECHRANIRKKLGIQNKKINLRTRLQFINE